MGRVKVLCLFLAIVFVMGVVPFVAASSASAEGVKVVAGPFRSYAVLSDNSLWGWGRSLHGETWGMFSDDSYVPRKIMDGVASVAAGSTHTMVVKTDGTLWAFGENEYGELGDNTYTIRQAKPVKVMEDVAQVAAGQHHTVALKADGSLWAWGRNEMGQLGNGATTDSRTPLRIMDGVTLVAAGNRSTMAIKADASLWAWGWNQDGQLGDGTTTNRLRPTKIMENAAFVTSTDHIHNHSAVIKTDGSLWLFGYNGSRQFGDDSGVTNELNPLPVKVMDGVVSVAVGGQRTSAVTKDGKLWGWGLRYLDIETLNDVAYVTKSTSHTMIVKTDGSLWAWGSNEHGEIGDGTTMNRFSPVRITLPKASVIPKPKESQKGKPKGCGSCGS